MVPGVSNPVPLRLPMRLASSEPAAGLLSSCNNKKFSGAVMSTVLFVLIIQVYW